MTDSPADLEASLRRAADAIAGATALLVTAGAGMGVDSGLPDFRGNEGFWRAYPPLQRLGLRFEQMASPRWFHDDPPLAWGFYGHRLALYRATEPHAGFGLLREWASRMRDGASVFTSNVDGQFQRAGFGPDRVVECHGSIHHLQCVRSCTPVIWDADAFTPQVDPETMRATGELPRCPSCGELARPNILMFGDFQWDSTRTELQERRLDAWLRTLAARPARRLVVVEMGAGTAISTVRSEGEALASRLDGTLVRLNPREPQVPAGHVGLPLGALDGLRRIQALLG